MAELTIDTTLYCEPTTWTEVSEVTEWVTRIQNVIHDVTITTTPLGVSPTGTEGSGAVATAASTAPSPAASTAVPTVAPTGAASLHSAPGWKAAAVAGILGVSLVFGLV